MDAFKVLGIDYDASGADIKKAYRKLAKKFHPDIEGGSEEEFVKISKAYEKLKGWEPLEFNDSSETKTPSKKNKVTDYGKFKSYQEKKVKSNVILNEQHSFNNHVCLAIFTIGLAISFGGYIVLKETYVGLTGIATLFVSAMMKVYSSIIESRKDFEI